ncbi:iron chelate uptake ABC transporter family permease subunit [Phaeobacter sp. B1627]|uniref:FecCD family ABC transporter permease n=1 Tax=Phaeobacter sp. B1627 TaxID=2583809 RepID=UPI00111B98E2|nr:iron ABC transporter permease [Phaeobacter sp. B1627]TNJ42743.1 iron ABC transporter permease [Phaeobacter sp. B1627]
MRMTVAICALLALAALSLAAGRIWLGPNALWDGLIAGPNGDFLIWELRLPRVVAGLSIGAGLGLSGAVFQSLLRNPLASPDIVGITQGAAFGGVALQLAGGAAMAGAAAGGLLTMALIFSLSLSRSGGIDPQRLVLYGIGCGITCSAGLNIMIIRAGDAAAGQAMAWLAGSLNSIGWPEAALAAGVTATLGLGLAGSERVLDRIELGDDLARAWGIRLRAWRPALATGAALLASAMVAVAGPLAFVAFVSGPVARRLGRGGPNLIGTALTGAALVTLSDMAARALAPSALLPAGIYTAMIGAPWLIYILTRRIRTGQL